MQRVSFQHKPKIPTLNWLRILPALSISLGALSLLTLPSLAASRTVSPVTAPELNQPLNRLVPNPAGQTAFRNGNTQLTEGNYAAAVTSYNQALQQNPELLEAYVNRGIAHTFQGDYPSAIADYGQALKLRPQDASLYTNRGIVWTLQSNFPRALADYDQALRLDPNNATAFYNRGVTRALAGDKQLAMTDLKTAANLYQQQGKQQDAADALGLMESIQ